MVDVFSHSAEIRWFLQGYILEDPIFDRVEEGQYTRFEKSQRTDPILDWFKGTLSIKTEDDLKLNPAAATGPFVKQENERTDEYLLLPATDKASFKKRQGKLELKVLVAGPHPFSAGTVTGRIDEWVKWSFGPSEAKLEKPPTTSETSPATLRAQLAAEMKQAGPWQTVKKERYLQKYSFEAGQLVAVPPDLLPKTGCQIELTKVTLFTVADWLTFGFEAFAPSDQSDQVTAILDQAVQEFFKTHGQAPLLQGGWDSLSYPAWLVLLR
jgi:hypothetical protein